MDLDEIARIREKDVKDAAEAPFDVGFYSLKYRGTVYGPEKSIPEHLRKYRHMNGEEYNHYIKKATKSDGYDVSGCNTRFLPGGIVEMTGVGVHLARLFAEAAVSEYNTANGTKFQYLDLVKANGQGVSGFLYYMTFRVLDDANQEEKLYRLKLWVHPHLREKMGKRMTIVEFHEAPHPQLKRKLGIRKKKGGVSTRVSNPSPRNKRKPGDVKFTSVNNNNKRVSAPVCRIQKKSKRVV